MKIDCAHDALIDVDKLLLLQNPKNNNKHPKEQIDRLAKIIDFQGQRHPIVVSNRSGFITKGHGRVLAIHKLGWKQAAVDYQDYVSEAQEYADMTADNEIARWAELDTDKMLEDIKDLDLGDIELLGLKEIPELLSETSEGLTDADEVPDVAQNIHGVVIGQIYKLGEHRLMCGDSTNIDSVKKLMSGEQPVLMVTDPPYGVSYDAEWRKAALGDKFMGKVRTGKVSNDDKADWENVYALSNCQIAYVWHASAFSDVVMNGLRNAGYEIKQQIIWNKTVAAMSRQSYHWKHEPCWYACKKGKDLHWNGDRKQNTVWDGASPLHIMSGSKEEKTEHPTQKPVMIYENPIRNHLLKGESLYDPFGGSGSAIIACEKLNRKCFTMELDPHYCSVIIERWQNFTGKKAELLNG